MTSLATLELTTLKGVGPHLADKLKKLGLYSVQDMLFHLPLRYEDRTRISPIGSLEPGMRTQVIGSIDAVDVVFRGRRTLVLMLSDGTGWLALRFFHFSPSQRERLKRGVGLRCFGEVRPARDGLEMVHPEYEFVDIDQQHDSDEHLSPVYPATEGVRQGLLRKLMAEAYGYIDAVTELVPQSVLDAHSLMPIGEALAYIHRPPPEADVRALASGMHPAQQRLAFEELMAHHLSLLAVRASAKAQQAPQFGVDSQSAVQLIELLPFSLTGAQQRVWQEIRDDLALGAPMQRLVQGDVGSGKTVIAALAALQAIDAGYQVALMAPTELLVDQHYTNLQQWLAPLGVSVLLVSAKLKAAERKHAHLHMASGEAQLVVGTHALFQEAVSFAHLGLVIVDEQHRFGVHQRLALREKGMDGKLVPHQLIMTATPIPRTLAQSVYADLDVSIIDELPPGRATVTTVALPQSRREEVVARVAHALEQDRQVYWVCPLVEESELLAAQAATQTAKTLAKLLPASRIGLVHGRLSAMDKADMMAAFKDRRIDVLVATTVIEVGVDVPNASLMIIENAERLGLSQLHQLRGRIGRGSVESSCVMMYQAPLSKAARARLDVMRRTHDGFEVARCDLAQRGPGEVLGTRQTGLADLHIADFVRDSALLPAVQQSAQMLFCGNPEAARAVVARWIRRAEDYASV